MSSYVQDTIFFAYGIFWILLIFLSAFDLQLVERPNGKPTDTECQLCSPSNSTAASRDHIIASGHPLLDNTGNEREELHMAEKKPKPKEVKGVARANLLATSGCCPSVFEEVVRITTHLAQIVTARWPWGWEGDSDWEILTINKAKDNLTIDFAILTFNQIPSSTRHLQSKCVWKREVATGDTGPGLMASSCIPSFIWI